MNEGVLSRDATGRVKVSTSGTLKWFASGAPIAITGELCVRSATPVRWLAGLGYDASGNLCISDGGTPKTYIGGLAVDSSGALCMSGSNAIAKYVAGMPVDSLGRVCVAGLAPPITDTDAIAWQTRVTGNGGTVSAGTMSAVQQFCISAKANGYWGALWRINLFAGDQLTACLTPLKSAAASVTPPYDTLDGNNGFLAGDYTEATGLQGNGSKYINTGMLDGDTSYANIHHAVYNRSSVAANVATMGCRNTGDSAIDELRAPGNNSAVESYLYNGVAGQGILVSPVIAGPFGFIQSVRSSATSHVIYHRGVSIASSSTSAGGQVGLRVYVFATNRGGPVNSICSYLLAGYSFGSSMTPAQAASYAADMQTFQTALGRAV